MKKVKFFSSYPHCCRLILIRTVLIRIYLYTDLPVKPRAHLRGFTSALWSYGENNRGVAHYQVQFQLTNSRLPIIHQMPLAGKPDHIHHERQKHTYGIGTKHTDEEGLGFLIQLHPAESDQQGFEQPDEKDGEDPHIGAVGNHHAEPDGVQWPPRKAMMPEYQDPADYGTKRHEQILGGRHGNWRGHGGGEAVPIPPRSRHKRRTREL